MDKSNIHYDKHGTNDDTLYSAAKYGVGDHRKGLVGNHVSKE